VQLPGFTRHTQGISENSPEISQQLDAEARLCLPYKRNSLIVDRTLVVSAIRFCSKAVANRLFAFPLIVRGVSG